MEAPVEVKPSISAPSGSTEIVKVNVKPPVVTLPPVIVEAPPIKVRASTTSSPGSSFWDMLWRPSSPETLQAIQSGFASGYQMSGGRASVPTYNGLDIITPGAIGTPGWSLPMANIGTPTSRGYSLPKVGLSTSRGRGGGGLSGGSILPIVGGIAILGGLVLFLRKRKKKSI